MVVSYSMVELTKDYFRFHYGRGVKEYLHICLNILGFIGHFFSIWLLFKTLLHPLKRLDESYSKGINPEAFFSTLIVNSLMRLVGFIVRFSIISMGIISYAVMLPLMFAGFLFWVFMPVIIALSLSTSITLMLKAV